MRYSLKKWCLLILAAVLLLGPAAGPARADTTTDREQLKKQIIQSATLQIDYWGRDWQTVPPDKRIRPAPADLVEKICVENQLVGFKQRPVPADPPAELALALRSILERLPEKIRRLLFYRLVGILTVKDLGGTGYSEVVFDERKRPRYGIIVLDVDILTRKTANTWAAWKLNSMFKPVTGHAINIRSNIEEVEGDTAINAIRFILLHEIGHILGLVTRVHPLWPPWRAGRQINPDTGFAGLSWTKTEDGRLVSRFDARFPERELIRAYTFESAVLTTARIPDTYAHLVSHSNFPTLYACESPWEDFAESFATYFHVVIDRRPWQIIITEEGQPDRIIGSCWGTPRCRDKEAFLETWFKHPDGAQNGRP